MEQSRSSTWPRDVLLGPKDLERDDAGHLICFLACPFNPPSRAEDLQRFIQNVCSEIGFEIGAKVQCVRADEISTPGTIHEDIWRFLQLADVLIFDVTGNNGNVLLELGVAASCRTPDHVIVLRDQEDVDKSGGKFLFDISPTRHLTYNLNLSGSQDFRRKLRQALLHALTPAPFKPDPQKAAGLPFEAPLDDGHDNESLLSPPVLFRRLVPDGLEFGSLYIFRHSWLTVGDENYQYVRIKAEMRFSDRAPGLGPSDGWIGIALRSEHFYANYGHLVYLKSDGTICHTEPCSEFDYKDIKVDRIPQFDHANQTFIPFEITFSSDEFSFSVGGGKPNEIGITSMPYVRHAGKVRFQTHRCRAVLRHVLMEKV